MKKITYSFLFIGQVLLTQFAFGQDSTIQYKTTEAFVQTHTETSTNTSAIVKRNSVFDDTYYRFKPAQLIIPGAFIAYGSLSLFVGPLKTLNHSTASEVREDRDKKLTLDNYAQFAPVAMVYGANLFGLKGKHNFKDRTIILGTSAIITTALVESTKHIVKEERPDKSDQYSFPSGHTATAFATAQFQFMEYKDENIWYALAGYPFAVFTGIYRVVNNKHYVGDVVAGAGVGMLSTQAAYWLFPTVNRTVNKIFSKKKTPSTSVMISPFYQNKSFGLGLVKTF